MSHWCAWLILLFSCERALLRDVRGASKKLSLVRPDVRDGVIRDRVEPAVIPAMPATPRKRK